MTSAATPQRLRSVEMDLDRTARELFALRDQVARLRTEVTAPAAWPLPQADPTPWSATPHPSSPQDAVRHGPPSPAAAHPDPWSPGPAPQGPAAQDPAAQDPAPQNPPPTTPPWWRREGAVARVWSVTGAAVLLVGVTFLLVLAVQHGYFGAVPRVVAGAVVTGVLVALGLGVHRRQADNPGAVALVGTGVAGGYLVVVAITTVYGWVDLPVGLLLAGGVCAAGLGLARRWGSEVLTVIVLLGVGVLAPLVATGQLWMGAAFLVLVGAAATIAVGRQDWPIAHLARVVPTALVLTVAASTTDDATPEPAGWVLTGLATAFALLTVTGELRLHRAGSGPRRSAALAALAIAPALASPLWLTTGWVSTLWLAVLAAVLLACSTRARSSMLATVLVSAGAVGLLLAVGSLSVEGSLVPSVLVVALVFVGAGVLRSDRAVGGVGVAVGALGVVGYLVVVAKLVLPVLADGPTAWDLVASVVVVGLVALTWRFLRDVVPHPSSTLDWAVLLPLGLVGLVGVCVSAGSLLGSALGDATAGFLVGHAVATLAWMAIAATLLLGTRGRPDTNRLRFAVVLTGSAVAKLVLFDLATLDGLIRVGAFVVVGAILLAVGTRYARAAGPVGPATR